MKRDGKLLGFFRAGALGLGILGAAAGGAAAQTNDNAGGAANTASAVSTRQSRSPIASSRRFSSWHPYPMAWALTRRVVSASVATCWLPSDKTYSAAAEYSSIAVLVKQ